MKNLRLSAAIIFALQIFCFIAFAVSYHGALGNIEFIQWAAFGYCITGCLLTFLFLFTKHGKGTSSNVKELLEEIRKPISTDNIQEDIKSYWEPVNIPSASEVPVRKKKEPRFRREKAASYEYWRQQIEKALIKASPKGLNVHGVLEYIYKNDPSMAPRKGLTSPDKNYQMAALVLKKAVDSGGGIARVLNNKTNFQKRAEYIYFMKPGSFRVSIPKNKIKKPAQVAKSAPEYIRNISMPRVRNLMKDISPNWIVPQQALEMLRERHPELAVKDHESRKKQSARISSVFSNIFKNNQGVLVREATGSSFGKMTFKYKALENVS